MNDVVIHPWPMSDNTTFSMQVYILSMYAYYTECGHIYIMELTCFIQCECLHCCWSITSSCVPCKDGGIVLLTWVGQVDHNSGGGVGHCSPTH